MTAQDAFQSWVLYCAAIANGVIALVLGIAILVVAFRLVPRQGGLGDTGMR